METKFLKTTARLKYSLYAAGMATLTVIILFWQQTMEHRAGHRPGILYAIACNRFIDSCSLFYADHLLRGSDLNQAPAIPTAGYHSSALLNVSLNRSAEIPQNQAMGLLKGKKLISMPDMPFADSPDTGLKQGFAMAIAQPTWAEPITFTLSTVQAFKKSGQMQNRYVGEPSNVYFAVNGKAGGKYTAPVETLQGQMYILFNKASAAEQARGLIIGLRNKTQVSPAAGPGKSCREHDLGNMERWHKKSVTVPGQAIGLKKQDNRQPMTTWPGLLINGRQWIHVGAQHLVCLGGIAGL